MKREYGLVTTQQKPNDTYDVIVLAVAHEKFLKEDLSCFKNENTLVYDIKSKLTTGYKLIKRYIFQY